MGDNKDDLTRIEDLSEYLHPEDPESEALLDENELSLDSEDELEQDLENEINFSEPEDDLSFGDENLETIEEDEDQLNVEEPEESIEFSVEQTDDDVDLDLAAEDDSLFQESEEDLDDNEVEENTPQENTAEDLSFDESTPSEEEPTFEFQEQEDVPIVPSEVQSKEDIISEEKSDIELPEEGEPTIVTTTHEPMTDVTPQKKERENFQEVRNFGNNLTYGHISNQANPPFSILVEGISTQQQVDDFLTMLKEHGLATADNEADYVQSMEYGRLLISQISEYSAIYLAHKIRSYPVKIQLGLADQIYSSDSYEDEGQGLVSTRNIDQNHMDYQNLEEEHQQEEVILSTSLTLDNYSIDEYLDIITVEKNISESEFLDENESILQNEYYQPLTEKMKQKARNIRANGIVGVEFHHTYLENHSSYKILCSGNAVRLTKTR